MDDLSQALGVPTQAVLTCTTATNPKKANDLELYRLCGEKNLRIGPPDKSVINQKASLLEQLEIEVEFEENIDKLKQAEQCDYKLNQAEECDYKYKVESSDNSRIKKRKDKDNGETKETVPLKDLFIADIKRASKNTSRPSQTVKTSLGKKSILKHFREEDISNKINDDKYNELMEKFDQHIDIGTISTHTTPTDDMPTNDSSM